MGTASVATVQCKCLFYRNMISAYLLSLVASPALGWQRKEQRAGTMQQQLKLSLPQYVSYTGLRELGFSFGDNYISDDLLVGQHSGVAVSTITGIGAFLCGVSTCTMFLCGPWVLWLPPLIQTYANLGDRLGDRIACGRDCECVSSAVSLSPVIDSSPVCTASSPSAGIGPSPCDTMQNSLWMHGWSVCLVAWRLKQIKRYR